MYLQPQERKPRQANDIGKKSSSRTISKTFREIVREIKRSIQAAHTHRTTQTATTPNDHTPAGLLKLRIAEQPKRRRVRPAPIPGLSNWSPPRPHDGTRRLQPGDREIKRFQSLHLSAASAASRWEQNQQRKHGASDHWSAGDRLRSNICRAMIETTDEHRARLRGAARAYRVKAHLVKRHWSSRRDELARERMKHPHLTQLARQKALALVEANYNKKPSTSPPGTALDTAVTEDRIEQLAAKQYIDMRQCRVSQGRQEVRKFIAGKLYKYELYRVYARPRKKRLMRGDAQQDMGVVSNPEERAREDMDVWRKRIMSQVVAGKSTKENWLTQAEMDRYRQIKYGK
ncbi:hypothetical protein B0T22DRAFT_435609 [Podospora appendiculata]|uniref:Uncharacterized protein n=1 Tax=Podospora appendiculata TaxID=314037 RepID=A0AAE0XF52_9PEZI|nr:hypothetical protein B0T22DRAFT_435609 [Podospora appendiculata]